MSQEESGNPTRRRHMHTRTIECNGYLRDDGLWEVEARLRDTKPFSQSASRYREELKPGAPVHDIALRLAIDDSMTVREAQATMRATPYPTCIEVEPILQRLVGERVGSGWRDVVRRKLGRLESCTRPRFTGEPARPHRAAVLRRRLPFLAHRRPDRRRHVPAVRHQACGAGLGGQLSRSLAFTTSACGSPLGRMSRI
jgi:hypothetical protein